MGEEDICMQDQATIAIKCKECGSPSYFDQKAEGFACPYCGSFAPWESEYHKDTSEMAFRHLPIRLFDGLINLTHVGTEEDYHLEDHWLPGELRQRRVDLEEKLYDFDKGTFERWSKREEITFDCSYCGAKNTGFSTQSLFICEYCNNKIVAADVFESGAYGDDLVFGDDGQMYKQALDFKITREEAIEQLLRLVAEHRSDFPEDDIKKRIRSDLKALYLPYLVEDFSIKATVDTERGVFTFYQDRINWASPQNSIFDIYLLDQLNPWDYGESRVFTPAFLENEIYIFAPMKDKDLETARQRIIYRDIPHMLKSQFGLEDVKLKSWSLYPRRHKYPRINLPIWFLDKASGATEADLQIRMAVNGQTGKAAAQFLKVGKKDYKIAGKDYIRTIDPRPEAKMSDESTIYSRPIAIEYVKPPFLFQTYKIDEVLGKKKSKFKRWFEG